MPVTDQDARALTYLACRIRKETHSAREWDENGTYAVIKRFVGHNLALTVERVTRHASDPEARTPAAMERPFVPDAPQVGPARPPKREEACELHGGHKDRCPGCAADRLTGDVASRPAPVRNGPTEEYLRARAAQHPPIAESPVYAEVATRAAHPTPEESPMSTESPKLPADGHAPGAPSSAGSEREVPAVPSAGSDCACGSPDAFALTPGERLVHDVDGCRVESHPTHTDTESE